MDKRFDRGQRVRVPSMKFTRSGRYAIKGVEQQLANKNTKVDFKRQVNGAQRACRIRERHKATHIKQSTKEDSQ
ncbi:hypothetical protein LINPERPRIM_LOCUS40790, partial [Linum perenne]